MKKILNSHKMVTLDNIKNGEELLLELHRFAKTVGENDFRKIYVIITTTNGITLKY